MSPTNVATGFWLGPQRWLLLLSQLFGCTTVNVGQTTTRNTRMKYVKLVAHCCWASFLLAAIVHSMIAVYYGYKSKRERKIRLVTVFEYAAYVVSCVLAIGGSIYQRHSYATYGARILEIDETLGIPLATSGRSLAKVLRHAFGIIGIFGALTTAIVLDYTRLSLEHRYYFWMAFSVPSVNMLLVHLQYYSLLFLVKQRYGWIQQILCNMSTKRHIFYDNNLCNKIRRSDERDRCWFSITNREYEKWTFDDFRTAIVNLLAVYRKLSALERSVSSSFGLYFVFGMATTFVVVLMKSFQLYFTVTLKFDLYLMLYVVLWLAVHCGKVVLVLEICHSIVQVVNIKTISSISDRLYTIVFAFQKRSIARAVHQVRFQRKCCNNDDIVSLVNIFGNTFNNNKNMSNISLFVAQVTNFSMLILHEKQRQMACGIIKMDLTIVGGVSC